MSHIINPAIRKKIRLSALELTYLKQNGVHPLVATCELVQMMEAEIIRLQELCKDLRKNTDSYQCFFTPELVTALGSRSKFNDIF